MSLISPYLNVLIRIRQIQMPTIALKGNFWFKDFPALISCTVNFRSPAHTSKTGELCILVIRGLSFFFLSVHFGWCGRFDIEGDDETQLNFTSHERTQIPSTLIPSPPHQADPQKRKQQNIASNSQKTVR